MKALLLVLLLAPLASAPILLLLGRRLGPRVGWPALVAPLLAFGACVGLYLLPGAEGTTLTWAWIPRLGIDLSFTPDGLALFFGLLVTGIGALVTFYAVHYLDDRYEHHGQFYCILQLFMAAMLATVFSSNLLVLFVAWELTGITSFFLIGFQNTKPEAQRGARMALVTTVTTGLALLVGIVLLQQVYGTFDLGSILGAPSPRGHLGLVNTAFFFCAVGIFGKSAIVPFHYWLPNAMAAPTPVSAYLHSATMVKLGVFLTARLIPVFGGLESWGPVLISFGFLTFLLGAILALLSYDLKAVLAYTTVAQLGMLVGQYGWGSETGPLFGDYVHILNHSLYKACLFMVVGIIDHSMGTRDLHQLGGVFKRMPLTGVAALVGLGAMAGLPLTSGFISKELLLEGGLTQLPPLGAFSLVSLVLGSILHALIALRIAKHALFGAMPDKLRARFQAPSLGLQLPPLLLASGVLLFGLNPAAFGTFAGSFGSLEVPELSLWHGWTTAAFVSLAVFLAAGLLFWLTERSGWAQISAPRTLEVGRPFERLLEGIPFFGLRLNHALGFTRLTAFLPIIVAVVVATALAFLLQHGEAVAATLAQLRPPVMGVEAALRWGVVALISTGALLAVVWVRPIPQLFAVSLAGFGIAFYYVLYRAPDLALTQLLVETASLLLVLLVVVRFKRDDADLEPLTRRTRGSRFARVAISVGGGLLLGLAVLLFPNGQVEERAGSYYLENTIPLAHGANAVNTIVVDFRGFDTLLEITVLLIAGLGCLGLLSRKRLTPIPEFEFPQTDLLPVPRDFILKSVALGGFVPLNVFALYIFFRGHDAPGGGFVAGLITALSLLLVAFVLGVRGFRRRLRIMPMRVAVSGVSLALAVALVPVLFGLPPLAHQTIQVGSLELGTTLPFDLGVYLAVVGVTLKLILPLMKSVHGLPAFVRDEVGNFTAANSEPIDFQPVHHPTETERQQP